MSSVSGTLKTEGILAYVVTLTVVAVVISVVPDFVITPDHKAIATNAAPAAANVTLGTPQLIGTEYDKPTSVKPTVVNGTHGLLATFAGHGVFFNGVNTTENATGFSTNITGGAVRTEGHGVVMSKNGMATFNFLAIGQVGPDGKARDVGTEFYPKATGDFASLANKTAVFKDEVDQAGNAVTKLWEFK